MKSTNKAAKNIKKPSWKERNLSSTGSSKLSVADLDRRLTAIEKKPKDGWDKLTALSGVLSAGAGLLGGILIASIGFYATNIYDQRSKESEREQRSRSTIATELQTVEKFLPHLASKDEATKAAAILAITSLGNHELATKLAQVFDSPGTRSALSAISASRTVDVQTREKAQLALTELYQRYKNSIAYVVVIGKLDSGDDRYTTGTAIVVSFSGYLLTASHLLEGFVPNQMRIKVSIGQKGGPSREASVVKMDESVDVALLKLSGGEALTPAPLAKAGGSAPTPLEQVTVLGFNEATESVTASGGHFVGVEANGSRYVLDTLLGPAASGSPVFNSYGEVIAIVVAGSMGQTFAIPIQHASGLLSLAGK